MLLLIILGLFFLAIVFFHYLQGFFSAALSAIFAVVAAVFAFSYHETIVEKLLGGKMADEAHAMVLLALFGIIYLVLRIIFDNAVPGNVRVPAAIDKAGAVIMGVIAAVFGTGIMAIAAQELPFGPSVGGYARFDVQDDRPVVVPSPGGRGLDRTEYTPLTTDRAGQFGDDPAGHGVPFLPVDNIVVGAVQKLSDGALSDGKPLETIHPAFLDELFGQRAGIEAGANHVAMNLPDKKLDTVDLVGLYTRAIPPADQKDGEFSKLRTIAALQPVPMTPGDMFLVVRVIFKFQGADPKDRVFRFSPGSVRLVAYTEKREDGSPGYEDFYPVGTLQNGNTLYLNKPDDYLFVQLSDHDQGADLVFKVPRKVFQTKAPEGSFLEVKRLARIDLANDEVKLGPPTNPDFNIVRKPGIVAPTPKAEQASAPPAQSPSPTSPTPAPSPSTPAPQPSADASLFQVATADVSDKLPVTVSAPAGQEATMVAVPGGTAVVAGGKLKSATLNSTPAEQTLAQKVTQFAVPEGQVMVQVGGTPGASSPWGVASEPDQYELVDSAGKRYQPNGIVALYDAGGAERFYLRYIDATTISGAAAPDGAGAPKRVYLFYLVPPGTNITELDDHQKKARDLQVSVK